MLSAMQATPCAITSDLDMRSAAEALRVVVVEDFDGLAPHRDAWNSLASSSPQALATLMPAWVEAYLRHRAKPGQRWLCCFAYDGPDMVGVLPVLVEPHPVLRHWRPLLQTLRIGDFAPSGDILLAPRHAGRALRAVLAALRRAVPGHLSIDLQAVHEHSPLWMAVKGGVDGYATSRYLRFPLSYINVQGDIETYLAGLGNLRRNLKRYRKKLDGRGAVTVEMIRNGERNEALLSEFLLLEAAGWKGRNRTAILDKPDVAAFYGTLMRAFSAQGQWEWHLVRLDGRLIAAGFGIRCGPCILLPKIAFDEDQADCMPGNLLTEQVIQDAFRRPDIEVLDHKSLAKWHDAWRMDQYEYSSLQLVRLSFGGILFQLSGISVVNFYKNRVVPRVPARMKELRSKIRLWTLRRVKARNARDA